MLETIPISFQRPMPVFPLPDSVLLPQSMLPLHIFESRYRKMTKDALDSYGLIAMALLAGEASKLEEAGIPQLRPGVCVGYIVEHQRLEDGKYNLLLQGVCRARIKEEVPSAPYRKALLDPLETHPLPEAALTGERERLEALFHDALVSEVESVRRLRRLLDPRVPTSALVDIALSALCEDTEMRYTLLAEEDVRARAQWLAQRLEDLRMNRGKERPPRGRGRSQRPPSSGGK